MAETIPSCGAHFVIVPLRNDVVVPQQDAVECPSSRLKIGAVRGQDNLIDHGVDRWVFNANQVVSAGLFGCSANPNSHVVRCQG